MNTQQKLEKTLAELVAIPSVSGNSEACHAVIGYVRNRLAPYGLFVRGDFECDNPWFIATTKDTNTPDILLVAHLDVVPAKDYKMETRDGKIYGRGVYDMKFAAACYLELLEYHTDQLAKLNIGFLFTTDEELGGHCIPDVLATSLRPKMVFIPDGGDNWQVEERAKGFYHTRLISRGKASHGSRPWEGDNAIHRLLEVLDTLHQSFPGKQPADSTLTISSFHGGDAINQTPDHAAATIDFRSFSPNDLAAHKNQVHKLAEANEIEVEVVQQGDPLILDKQSPAIQSFLATLETFTNQPIRYIESYGGTDGRFFAPFNIPCIIVEPRGGGRHADDEWLLAEDLSHFYKLLETWILEKA